MLVVLDNCEHLADGVAIIADRIAGAGTVDVLLTSRVPLRADDEHVVVLAPLVERDAARLFRDRLEAVASQDVASPADADVVAEIVGRLDGLPLVLELAAARVPGLGLRGLRDALDDPFGVLSGGHRSGRHGSLLDVVGGSFACSPTHSASCSATWPPLSDRSSSPPSPPFPMAGGCRWRERLPISSTARW